MSPNDYAKYRDSLDEILMTEMEKLNIKIEQIIEKDSYKNLCPNLLHNTISRSIVNVNAKMPHSKFNKKLKPYWSRELSRLAKNKKHVEVAWKQAGKPRQNGDILWQNYKQAKREFRQELRRAKVEYELKNMNQIESSDGIDTRFYWYLVNKSRRTFQRKVKAVYDENGGLITETDQIREEWYMYFKELFQSKDDRLYDKMFQSQIETGLKAAYHNSLKNNQTSKLDKNFTVCELRKVNDKLKTKKASGFDNISAENIKFGGIFLHKCLLVLYNTIVQTEKMPKEMKRGILMPIPKENQDPLIKSNNRGITLISVFYKQFQSLLKMRYEHMMDNCIADIQGAGRKNISCINTALMLRETIAHQREKNKDVFVAFLDVKKAFDTVWTDGLLYKLFSTIPDGKLCRIFMEMFDEVECAVQIACKCSKWFVTHHGIQQGAPLSLWFYSIFTNDLIVNLIESDLGAKIGPFNITCPTYADDMAIVTTNHSRMQMLLKMFLNIVKGGNINTMPKKVEY
jgi:hypothetical protein